MRFFVGLATMLLLFITSSHGQVEIPVSSFEKFNERGFSTSASFSARGKEIISDYDGNFSLQYSSSPDLPAELASDLTIMYNANVDHRALVLCGGDVREYTINAGEWIIGFKGFAIQTFNFETNNYTDGTSGSEIAMLIPGYHYTNKLTHEFDAPAFPGSESVGGRDTDYITILMADGSKKILYNNTTVSQKIDGIYYEPGKSSPGYAIVEKISETDDLRKMWYKPGDGITYYFEEEWSKLHGQDFIIHEPKVFYLKSIKAQSGWEINLNYYRSLDPYIYSGVITKGRKLVGEINLFDPNHAYARTVYKFFFKPAFERLHGLYIVDRMDDKNNPMWEPPVNYRWFLVFDQNKQDRIYDGTSLTSVTNRDQTRSKRVMLKMFIDKLNNTDQFFYTDYERNFDTQINTMTLGDNVLNRIHYSNGKQTEISYYTFFDGVSSQSSLNLESTATRYIDGNMKKAYRDPYTNFMVKQVQVKDENDDIVYTDTYNFTFDKDFYINNDNPEMTWDKLTKLATLETIKTIITRIGTQVEGTEYSGFVKEKSFTKYRTSYYDYNINDRTFITRLVNEKTSPFGNDPDLPYIEIEHKWYTGQEIGTELGYWTGRFNDKGLIENTKTPSGIISKIVTNTEPNNNSIFDIFSLGSGISKELAVLKQEKIFSGQDSKGNYKTINLQNFYPEPGELLDVDYYYLIGRPELETVRYYCEERDSIASQTKFEYFDNSSDPAIKYKIKKKTGNFHIEGREIETYFYYYNSEVPSIAGFPYQITSNGVTQEFSYLNTSVSNVKKLYRGAETSQLVNIEPILSNNGYKPFKTTFSATDNLMPLEVYNAYNERGELIWEIDINNNYSEFSYDEIGRMTSAAFPGSFLPNNDPIINTYTIRKQFNLFGIRNFVVDEDGDKQCPLEIGGYCTEPRIYSKVYEQNIGSGGTDEGEEGFSRDAEETGDGPGGGTLEDQYDYYYIAFDKELNGNDILNIFSASLEIDTKDYTEMHDYQTMTFKIEGIASPMEGSSGFTTIGEIGVGFQENTTMNINLYGILNEIKNHGVTLYGLKLSTQAIWQEIPGAYDASSEKSMSFRGGDYQPKLNLDLEMQITDITTASGTVYYTYDDQTRQVIQKLTVVADDTAPEYQKKIIQYNCFGEIIKSQSETQTELITDVTNYYNYLGKVYRATDAEGRNTYQRYDFLGRPIKQGYYEDLDCSPHISFNYDSYLDPITSENFYVEKITDEIGNWTVKKTDKRGSLRFEEKSVNTTQTVITKYEYDFFNRLQRVISPDSYETFFLYDELHSLAAKKTPHSGTYYYKFDKFGNMRYRKHFSSMMQSRLEYRRYDLYNRLTHIGLLYGDTNWDLLNPDVFDPESQESDGNTMLLLNEYRRYEDFMAHGLFNNFSLPIEFSEENNPYKGKLLATIFRNKADATTPWNLKAYKYDELGNIINFRQEIDNLDVITQTYSYNHVGTLLQHDIDGGYMGTFSQFFDYDILGRITQQKSNMNPVKTNAILDAKYNYNDAGQITRHAFGFDPEFRYVDYGYDPLKGLLTNTQYNLSDPPAVSVLFEESLQYLDNGNISDQDITHNISALSWNNQSFDYIYDGLSRLTNVAGSHNETVTYKNDGRISTREGGGIHMMYNYAEGGTERLLSIQHLEHHPPLTPVNTILNYSYDGRGNLISDERINSNDVILFNYTWDNLPLSMLTNGQFINYKYDDAGQRIMKDVNGQKEYYIRNFDGTEIGAVNLYEDELIEYKFKYFNLIGGGNIGRVECNWDTYMSGGIPYWTRTDERFYYIKDHLGSIRLTIEDDGSLFAAQDYDPWGKITRSWNPSTPYEKFKFTGKELDTETEYHYFGARYYDSFKAQWTSPDPLEDIFPGWNSYNYCIGNPVNYTDPNGTTVVGQQDSTGRFFYSLIPDGISREIVYNYEGDVIYDINLSGNLERRTELYKLFEKHGYNSSLLFHSILGGDHTKVCDWAAYTVAVTAVIYGGVGFEVLKKTDLVLDKVENATNIYRIITKNYMTFSNFAKLRGLNKSIGLGGSAVTAGKQWRAFKEFLFNGLRVATQSIEGVVPGVPGNTPASITTLVKEILWGDD